MRELQAFFVLFSLFGAHSARAVLYTNDLQTRTDSSPTDRKAVINLGASGFFIDSDILITANHVGTNNLAYPFEDYEMIPDQVLEQSNESDGYLDYKIQKVRWTKILGGTNVASDAPSDLKVIREISPLFVVSKGNPQLLHDSIRSIGFPFDHEGRATTSNGDLFYFADSLKPGVISIFYNLGSVPGNSGGPILDSKDRLLGFVTGGPFSDLRPIYDPKDPRFFNYGMSAKALYDHSPTFKKIMDQNRLRIRR